MLDSSEMTLFTEKLIEEIKDFPILFDRKMMRSKDSAEKEEAWISLTDRLPSDLKISVDETKKRWRTLKDCYSKYLRSGTTKNRFEARYKSWRWSGHMNFFKSYMLHNDSADGDESLLEKEPQKRKSEQTSSDIKIQPSKKKFKQNNEDEFIDEVYDDQTHTFKKKTLIAEIKGEIDEEVQQEIDDESYQVIASAITDYENPSTEWDELANESESEDIGRNSTTKSIASVEHDNYIDPLVGKNFDGLDMTFLGYAGSIKKLTPRRQSLIKFAVAKMIMREELSQQNEKERNEFTEFIQIKRC
ncbi:uncharacterized protein LOC105664883 [Ceratitis capitata]|uniref:(Mediterranean fruit fly) hypothetical protein n=1 Tax=Ceratitis capitata TaxID=7213 RepID=W8BWK7_CERCA|nr:uncharacterized protein LOC105664883 [Ceratitis capitata]CAD6996274.1 unnamed protein product [Ceratitis capitata]